MNEPDSSGTRVEHFRREFTRLVARPEEDLDLGLAALLIAGEEYPDLDVREHLDRLESFAATVNERAPETLSSEQRASGLASYLFGDLGFRGNSSDYYSPDNSYFNRVLETPNRYPHNPLASIHRGRAPNGYASLRSRYAGTLPSGSGRCGSLFRPIQWRWTSISRGLSWIGVKPVRATNDLGRSVS